MTANLIKISIGLIPVVIIAGFLFIMSHFKYQDVLYKSEVESIKYHSNLMLIESLKE